MRRQLDTFIGRTIQRVEPYKVVFSDGAEVRSQDQLPLTMEFENGARFNMLIYDERGLQMVLVELTPTGDGSEWRVPFKPFSYTIYDPSISEQEWNPHEPEEMLIPPHPDERIAEGPDQEYLDQQAAQEEEARQPAEKTEETIPAIPKRTKKKSSDGD